jgi:hypothetical protein
MLHRRKRCSNTLRSSFLAQPAVARILSEISCSSICSEVIDHSRDGIYPNVHSVLIVKNDELVFEAYLSGYAFSYLGDQFRGEYTEFGVNTLGPFVLCRWLGGAECYRVSEL